MDRVQTDFVCPKGHNVYKTDIVSGTIGGYLCRDCNLAYPLIEGAEYPSENSLETIEHYNMRHMNQMLDGHSTKKRQIPWENGGGTHEALVDTDRIKWLTRELLIAIGMDPEEEGLKDTPRRVAGFWQEFMEYEDSNIDTTFSSMQTDQMIIVSGIPAWSLCEHHLLPFSATVSVGYIPKGANKGGKIIGLSKIPRIVRLCSQRPQTQEHLVSAIHDAVEKILGENSTLGIAVIATGVHTCMTMRGPRSEGIMSNSRMEGVFRRQPEVRDEFFKMIGYADQHGRW